MLVEGKSYQMNKFVVRSLPSTGSKMEETPDLEDDMKESTL